MSTSTGYVTFIDILLFFCTLAHIHHLGIQDSLRGLVMAALHVDFFDQEHVVLHHLASCTHH